MSVDALRKSCITLSIHTHTGVGWWEQQPIWKLIKYVDLASEVLSN